MADNKDIREKVVREIEKTAESIRKKHRALKTGKIEEDIATKSHFKPIIEPLQKIVDNSSVIKDEPRDDVKTFSVQKREEDLKSSKRKRSSLDRKSKRLNASGQDAHSQTRMFSKPRTTRSRYPFKISYKRQRVKKR